MTVVESEATVLLSDSEAGDAIVSRLALHGCRVTRCLNLTELVDRLPFSSISVLIFHLARPPKGALLATIGRMGLEFPCIQKIAVVESPLPIVVVGYLTACGVELILTGSDEQKIDRLASAVNRMREQRTWCLAGSAN